MKKAPIQLRRRVWVCDLGATNRPYRLLRALAAAGS